MFKGHLARTSNPLRLVGTDFQRDFTPYLCTSVTRRDSPTATIAASIATKDEFRERRERVYD